jgi:hypothetical protein
VEHQFDIGLLEGYLELDTREMNNQHVLNRFQYAREILNQRAISLFTRQISLIGDCTSILARLYALSSIISQKSYSILGLTVVLPFVQRSITAITRLIPRPGRAPLTYVDERPADDQRG